MKRVYYMVYANDGSPVSNEMDTLRAARKEMKDIIKEDVEELGLEEGDIDYYIMKFTEYPGRCIEEEVR